MLHSSDLFNIYNCLNKYFKISNIIYALFVSWESISQVVGVGFYPFLTLYKIYHPNELTHITAKYHIAMSLG